jgi:hypothetical protein
MNLFTSAATVIQSDAIVNAYNHGELTEHQLEVALKHLEVEHMYESCPITGFVQKTFSPIFGE